MGFFDHVAPRGADPEPPRNTELLYAWPDQPWDAPPDNLFIPGNLTGPGTIAEGRDTRIVLARLSCWPDGVDLELTVFARRAPVRGQGRALNFPHPRQAGRSALRFGVRFADGRRATTLDQSGFRQEPSDTPVLRYRGGGTRQFRQDVSLYLWPLPPEGPLTLVVEWPEQGIRETQTTIDTVPIRAAAGLAVPVWPDLPQPPEGMPRPGIVIAMRME